MLGLIWTHVKPHRGFWIEEGVVYYGKTTALQPAVLKTDWKQEVKLKATAKIRARDAGPQNYMEAALHRKMEMALIRSDQLLHTFSF